MERQECLIIMRMRYGLCDIGLSLCYVHFLLRAARL